MSTRASVLLASINGKPVGSLRDENGVWSFEYAGPWIDAVEGFDLAPGLPRAAQKIVDGGTHRPVQWFFDNLLPEEAARELLARDAQIPSADAFGLLAWYGRESAGAITLLPPGETPPASGYVSLTDEELHERIARLPRHALASGAPKRMSLAGAQHKMAVSIRDGQLVHPVGDSPSTHILKPDHKDTDFYPSSAANEYFTMRLADRMGLRVPPVELRFVPDPVYLIERFDRRIVDTQVQRLHVVDACQLLGLDRSFKYQQSRWDTLVRCIELCQNRARTRQSLLAWTLFNLMVGNGDAHLKNISFMVTPAGIELAPFYDLVSTECYRAEIGNMPRWPAIALTMPIGNADTFGAVTREDFSRFAAELGSTRRAALRLVDEYCDKLERNAALLYDEFEQLPIANPLERAGALRTLSKIRFAAIRDMAMRLGRSH